MPHHPRQSTVVRCAQCGNKKDVGVDIKLYNDRRTIHLCCTRCRNDYYAMRGWSTIGDQDDYEDQRGW